ncbi:MAG: phosphatidylglycerol lysyltransferase domain-containing protein [Desulfobacterales bacterium]
MSLTFEPIGLDRQHDYLALVSQCQQPASDYSFLNLYAWAEEYGLSWAWDGRLVWIKQSRPQEALWAPVGDWGAVDWSGVLMAPGLAGRIFIRVPDTLAAMWGRQLGAAVQIEPERGHWDYIYEVSDLVDLPGNRFHNKRNLLNQFTKAHDFNYVDFGPRLIEQAMAMQEDWCTWRDCESSDLLSAENRAILRILDRWDRFDRISGGAIFVEEIIVAYTLAEPLTEDTLVIHFEKGCPAYKGVYQAINQMFLARSARSFRRVNREQDLGNEGLRKAKLSYNPIDFLKKSKVTLNP